MRVGFLTSVPRGSNHEGGVLSKMCTTRVHLWPATLLSDIDASILARARRQRRVVDHVVDFANGYPSHMKTRNAGSSTATDMPGQARLQSLSALRVQAEQQSTRRPTGKRTKFSRLEKAVPSFRWGCRQSAFSVNFPYTSILCFSEQRGRGRGRGFWGWGNPRGQGRALD